LAGIVRRLPVVGGDRGSVSNGRGAVSNAPSLGEINLQFPGASV